MLLLFKLWRQFIIVLVFYIKKNLKACEVSCPKIHQVPNLICVGETYVEVLVNIGSVLLY